MCVRARSAAAGLALPFDGVAAVAHQARSPRAVGVASMNRTRRCSPAHCLTRPTRGPVARSIAEATIGQIGSARSVPRAGRHQRSRSPASTSTAPRHGGRMGVPRFRLDRRRMLVAGMSVVHPVPAALVEEGRGWDSRPMAGRSSVAG